MQETVKDSVSVAEVLRKLGIASAGGSHSWISNRIKAFNIDTSHFLGQASNRGKVFVGKRKTPKQVLINSTKNVHAYLLRRLMIECGVEEQCGSCGIRCFWNGSRLILEVDHIDGNHCNNILGNLRFLCPNCHSQTATSKPWKNK